MIFDSIADALGVRADAVQFLLAILLGALISYKSISTCSLLLIYAQATR